MEKRQTLLVPDIVREVVEGVTCRGHKRLVTVPDRRTVASHTRRLVTDRRNVPFKLNVEPF